MPLLLDQLGPCPVCGAAVAVTGPLYRQHIAWHQLNDSMPADDESPTQKFPPIRETVLRRPPVPPPAEVRDLRGAELLRALARELDREDLAELDREDQADDEDAGGPCSWRNPDPAAAWPLACDFPAGACRGYGAPGCAMKAQEGR